MRQLKQEEAFDATQGRCCFWMGNRRGVRLIQFCDALFLLYLPRAFLAIMSLKNETLFQTYAKTRKATFILNVILLMGGILAFVIYDIFQFGGQHYLYILAAVIFSLVYLGVDYHWTNCVVFFWKHPPKRKAPIDWINSDSEPQYAFQRDPDCKEMQGVVLAKSTSEKLRELEEVLEKQYEQEMLAIQLKDE